MANEFDAACLRLANADAANISFANNSHNDVLLTREASRQLLGRLTPEHLRAMCQTIDDYLQATPNIPAAQQQLARSVKERCIDRITSNVPLVYMLSNRMYQVALHGGGLNTLRSVTTYSSPGAVVPSQVLHWINFRVDIKHALTMAQITNHGITTTADWNFQEPEFDSNCTEPEADSFFGNHAGLNLLTRVALPNYWTKVRNTPNVRFAVQQQPHSNILLSADHQVSMDGEVLVIFEIKALDGIQSRYIRRTNHTHGNLVRGYYGSNYNEAVSANPNLNVPVKLTAAQVNAPLNKANVDLQNPQGKEYIRESVYQICGYMVAYQLKYAVLSTSEMTWLLKMDENGRLFVSPGLNGSGAIRSIYSPTALLMSFLTHVAKEAEAGNSGHRLSISDNTRFYDFLDRYWTANPNGTDAVDTQMTKIHILQQMRDRWLMIQQAQQQAAAANNNNNNNNNNNGGGGAPGGNGQGPGNGGQPPPPPAPGAGPGGAANGDGIHNNAALIPANIINSLKDSFISVTDNTFAKKKNSEGSLRLDVIDMLPLKHICIGFPWELHEIHPSADFITPSIKMTVSGIPLVLKILDKEQEFASSYFDKEMEMYRGPLRSLQGLCTPYLFYAGGFTNDRQIIVTSREGAPLANMPDAVLKQTFIHEQMRQTLSTLHDNGITHNNICLNAFHMVVACENVRLYLTDFGCASYSRKRTKEFATRSKNDMQCLERQIKEIMEFE